MAETCNGTSASCPADQFQPSSLECRAATGDCDVAETCTGWSGACPTDGFKPSSTICRSGTGDCDIAETCTGSSATCPTDTLKGPGTVCTDDGNPCTTDTCDGGSISCQHSAGNAGAICRTTTGDCDVAETCTGSSVTCPADALKGSGSGCTDDGNPCTTDTCDGGSVTCQHSAGNAGAVCRTATGDCDLPETCTGTDASCPADGFKSVETACRSSAGECDVAEACTGSSAACPSDTFKTAGVSCTDDGNVCTRDQCNGSSPTCQHPAGNAGTLCRSSAAECDVAEACTGSSPSCPTDAFKAAGNSCADDGNVCTSDQCNGSSPTCQHPAGNANTVCRAAVGPCDVSERCTGTGASCPTDQVALGPIDLALGTTATQSSTAGGAAALAIDGNTDGNVANGSVAQTNAEPEAWWEVDLGGKLSISSVEVWNRTGAGSGELSSFYVFVSDVPFAGPRVSDALSQAGVSAYFTEREAKTPSTIQIGRTGRHLRIQLTRTDAIALAEVRVLEGTACRAAADVCDVSDLCDGSNATCPSIDTKQEIVCRRATGDCDSIESCNGVTNDCPQDQLQAQGTLCRSSAGECDVAEACTGSSAACPSDTFKTAGVSCTDDGNVCTRDQCNGSSPTCQHPAGNANTVCRAAVGQCDVAERCTGTSAACPANQFAPPTTVCRSSVGECDVAEACTGSSAACPSDTLKAAGITCTDDGSVCTDDQCNGTDTDCKHPSGNAGAICRPASGDCDVAEVCDGNTPSCPLDAVKTRSTICRAATGDCDLEEACSGSSSTCPVDSFRPPGTPCSDDREVCTNDVCNPEGACTHVANTASCADELFCNGEERCEGGACRIGTPPCPSNVCDENAGLCSSFCGDGLTSGDESCGEPGLSPCPRGQSCRDCRCTGDGPGGDRYACYSATRLTAPEGNTFVPRTRSITDQFEAASYDLSGIASVCAPATEEINDSVFASMWPDVFQTDYFATVTPETPPQAFLPRNQKVSGEFGVLALRVVRATGAFAPSRLRDLGPARSCVLATECATDETCTDGYCLPSQLPTVRQPRPKLGVDHFKCYAAKVRKQLTPYSPERGVRIRDGIGGSTLYDVLKPTRLCMPAEFDLGSPGAETHPDLLLCFKLKKSETYPPQASFSMRAAAVRDRETPRNVLVTTAPKELCIPAQLVTP